MAKTYWDTLPAKQIRLAQGIRVVALSGGVWQNRYLLERTLNRLEAAGFQKGRILLWRRRVAVYCLSAILSA